MPGARGHQNESGPREIFGGLTIAPGVTRHHKRRRATRAAHRYNRGRYRK